MVNEEYADLRSRVFFIWGGFCLISIAFVYFMIYETKGLTLEQVDELYGVVSKAWKSKEFRPVVAFRNATEEEKNMDLRSMSIAAERRASQVGTHPNYDGKAMPMHVADAGSSAA